jgi:hypothetical protein
VPSSIKIVFSGQVIENIGFCQNSYVKNATDHTEMPSHLALRSIALRLLALA